METFGPYELRRLLGRGGMGEVHEAFDTEHRRRVALKLLPAAAADDETFAERFRRESFSAAQLNDPHVIPIHRYGELDGRLYLDMRLVDGLDLKELLRRDGAFAPERAVSLVEQTAEALDAAHAAGLVHRDVKPSNLLVARHDFLYLVDFGIAHIIGSGSGTLTRTGATVGTLDYMAPERFVGTVGKDASRGADPTADVYSLACVLYELLTGRQPFAADEPVALMHAHLNTPPPAVTDVRPDLPGALDTVISRGMAKDPARRHASAGALAAHAREAVSSGPAAAVTGTNAVATSSGWSLLPTPQGDRSATGRGWDLTGETAAPRRRTPPAPRRRGAWVAGALVLVLALAAGGAYLVNREFRDDPTAGGAAAPPATSAAGSVPTSTATPPESAPTPPATPAPTTTPAPEGPLAGDLGLTTPISTPECNGNYVTFVGSATQPDTYAERVTALLDQYPDSAYLEATACSSLRPDSGGNAIYSVYRGPFATTEQACESQATEGGDAYVRVLDDVTPANQNVRC